MGYHSVMVHLDGDTRCDARVHLAAHLAATGGSHLLGVAATGRVELGTGLVGASHYLDEAATVRQGAVERAHRWADDFRRRCNAEGLTRLEAEVYEGERLPVLLHHAHCTDLTVISQADPASQQFREDQRFVEQVLVHNARPTLVVPHQGRFEHAGRRVLVAWDDSRASARATADAVPLLRDAQQVMLRVWRRHGEAPEALLHERLTQVQRWLSWQGVTVDARVDTTRHPIGEAILAEATTLGADLIVMGTYGHSRWTERLVGGATRTAFAQSTVPLLMSH